MFHCWVRPRKQTDDSSRPGSGDNVKAPSTIILRSMYIRTYLCFLSDDKREKNARAHTLHTRFSQRDACSSSLVSNRSSSSSCSSLLSTGDGAGAEGSPLARSSKATAFTTSIHRAASAMKPSCPRRHLLTFRSSFDTMSPAPTAESC